MTDTGTTAHPELAKHYKRAKIRRHRNLTLRRITRYWPLLIWLAAIAVVALIHSQGSQFGGMTGVVETTEELVAPIEAARLISVGVKIGQHIHPGDIIAQMDTSMLEAKKSALLAEQKEARNSIAGYQQDILLLARQFNSAIKNTETDILNIKKDQAGDMAELEELKKEQQRREKLASQNIISIRDLSELRPKIAGLEQRVSAYPAILKIHQRRLDDAADELNDLKHWLRLKSDDGISDVIQAKTTAHNEIIKAKLAMLNLQIESYTLKASRDGIVARVQAQPGDIIQAGQVVVRLVSENSTRVVGFLPEVFLGNVEAGSKAVIWRERDAVHMAAVVESIAPDVRTLPGRITPMNSQSIRGRRIVLTVSGNHRLIPGETVKIKPHPKPLIDLKKIFSSSK